MSISIFSEVILNIWISLYIYYNNRKMSEGTKEYSIIYNSLSKIN